MPRSYMYALWRTTARSSGQGARGLQSPAKGKGVSEWTGVSSLTLVSVPRSEVTGTSNRSYGITQSCTPFGRTSPCVDVAFRRNSVLIGAQQCSDWLVQLIRDCPFVSAATQTICRRRCLLAVGQFTTAQESNAATKPLTNTWILLNTTLSGDAMFGEWDGAGSAVMRQTGIGSKVVFLQPVPVRNAARMPSAPPA
jgi:hypothetical protein